jgi:hypothetical protein
VNEPKRHHVVPDFYLQRWAKNEKLIVVDRDDPAKRYPAAVKDASVERYFYALPTESGWDMTVEKTLSKLESIAAVDIGKVLEGRSTTLPAFRTRLSFFMAVQLVRGRAPRQAMIDFYKDIFLKTAQLSTPEIIQAQAERRGEPMTIEAAREVWAYAQNPSLKVEFQKIGPKSLPADSLVNAVDVFKQAEQLIKFFYTRKWVVADFGAPILLTGDEPVAVGVDTRDPHHPAGLANADSVMFPLDPQRALVMMRPDFDPPLHSWIKGTAVEAKALNQMIAFRAMRQIFYHPDTSPMDGLEIPGSPKHPGPISRRESQA